MEIQFEKNFCRYLDPVLRQTGEQEQTQEIRLADGMPDIGRVITSWGQVVIRSKEWRSDCVSVSGGVMVWILYAPEDGSGERWLDEWVPFKMKWELPDGVREGQIRVSCRLRFLDGRNVSPRKIMLRVGIGALAEAFSPGEAEVYMPGDLPSGLEVLKRSYPVRVNMEAGEKAFSLEETLTLPESCPKPERLVYCTMQPELTERKLLADKAVFRGNGNLHLMYRAENGQLHTWDFDLPFSQLAQLEEGYSQDAGLDVMLGITSLEPELDVQGQFRVKCGLVGQYVVSDRKLLELAEDAYCPGSQIAVDSAELMLPVLLDQKVENIALEQTLPMNADVIVDCVFYPEQPRSRRRDNGVEWELTGMVQALGYGENGTLQACSARWEGNYFLPADEDSRVFGTLEAAGRPNATAGDGSVAVSCPTRLAMETRKNQSFPMITALQQGQPIPPDPARPSVILCRAGEEALWSLAKRYGTTVAAIESANGLQEAPAPDQLLLIPVL